MSDNYLDDKDGKLFEAIRGFEQMGLFVDSFEMENRKGLLKLSDGTQLRFKGSFFLAAIGFNGFWSIDGEKTTASCDEYNKDAIDYRSADFSQGDLMAVLEGYTYWDFIFYEKPPIRITKTLYSYDPDDIQRGVNHRGYCTKAPENTLPAFRMSRLHGFKYVETDVRHTSDGVAVLLHDSSVNRTSNGEGEVDKLSFSQLSSLDFGSWKGKEFKNTKIPTFEEFLDLCSKIGLEPNIELKDGTRKQIINIVSNVGKYGLKGKVRYISFQKVLLDYVLDQDPEAYVELLCGDVTSSVIKNAYSLLRGSNKVSVSASDYSIYSVNLCRNSGLPLCVWAVDSKSEILSLPDYISGVTSDALHAGRVKYEAMFK